MTYLVDVEVDEVECFYVDMPDAGVRRNATPIDPMDIRSVKRVGSDTGPLPVNDFSYAAGSGPGCFLVSEAALKFVHGQTGLWVAKRGLLGALNLSLVQIVLQLDVLDRGRSVESPIGVGLYSGIHVIGIADELAGNSLFVLPPPNHRRLLCSATWRSTYEASGLTGLTFEIAEVG